MKKLFVWLFGKKSVSKKVLEKVEVKGKFKKKTHAGGKRKAKSCQR